MKKGEFTDKIIESRERVVRLHEEAKGARAKKSDLVAESLEQLQVTLEELQVAQEELRSQNDELIAAHEMLEAERYRYQNLFEFAPDAYLVTTPEGIIREANRAAEELFDMPKRFLIGKPLISYIEKDHHKAFRMTLFGMIDAESVQSLELRLQPRDQKPFDIVVRATPERHHKGRLTGLRWLMHDITDRKRTEDETRAMAAELECRVAERTAELQEANSLKDRLLVSEQAARAEAEAANRGKDDFLATLSHELRTPLNSILGWIHILSTHLDDPAMVHRAVEVIERNASAQARLINDILEVSRIITGKLKLNLQPIEIAPVIREAIEAARPLVDAKAIQLEVALDPKAGQILGDASRLQQVAANLLSNAVKFTPREGKVAVTLAREGAKVRLTVSDTGQGIKPAFLPLIFDRFRQAESPTTRYHGGLGLGLAIVRHIVEAHGGAVWAASGGEGQGASFVVRLPATAAEDVSPAVGKKEDYDDYFPEAELYRFLEGLRILVVDDEVDARQMLRVLLGQAGARVTTAGSCDEAIQMLSDGYQYPYGSLPDVLIADIAMPGGDGFELIRALRKMENGRKTQLPAIALTAYADEENRQRALAEGFQMHMAKPVRLNDLALAVIKLVAGK